MKWMRQPDNKNEYTFYLIMNRKREFLIGWRKLSNEEAPFKNLLSFHLSEQTEHFIHITPPFSLNRHRKLGIHSFILAMWVITQKKVQDEAEEIMVENQRVIESGWMTQTERERDFECVWDSYIFQTQTTSSIFKLRHYFDTIVTLLDCLTHFHFNEYHQNSGWIEEWMWKEKEKESFHGNDQRGFKRRKPFLFCLIFHSLQKLSKGFDGRNKWGIWVKENNKW